MGEKVRCFKCDKEINPNEAGLGMNMGFGPRYWCRTCEPPMKAEDIIKSMDRFMNPKKEKGK